MPSDGEATTEAMKETAWEENALHETRRIILLPRGKDQENQD